MSVPRVGPTHNKTTFKNGSLNISENSYEIKLPADYNTSNHTYDISIKNVSRNGSVNGTIKCSNKSKRALSNDTRVPASDPGDVEYEAAQVVMIKR